MKRRSTDPPSGSVPTATFHILMALARNDLHGYAILQDIEKRTDGKLRMSAGTLYRSIHRMLEQGLVVELRKPPDPTDTDKRRRYYRLTPAGLEVARSEARRMSELIDMARRCGLLDSTDLAPESA